MGKLTQPDFGRYPLWNSDYEATYPIPYTPWSHVALWQHTSTASYPTVDMDGHGHCDESFFFGTIDELRALAGSGDVVPPAPPMGNYVVRPGDSMSGIATAYNVGLAALEAASPQVSDPNQISVGDVLHIPGASPSGPHPGPHPGHLTVACALKVEPNHSCAALTQAPAHDPIMVLPWQATTNGEKWQRVRWRDKEGWVPAANVGH